MRIGAKSLSKFYGGGPSARGSHGADSENYTGKWLSFRISAPRSAVSWS